MVLGALRQDRQELQELQGLKDRQGLQGQGAARPRQRAARGDQCS